MRLVIAALIVLLISSKFSRGKIRKALKCGSNIFSNKTACYAKEIDDDLLHIDEESVDGNNSIFFIETSCGGGLNYRQACSVESAARAHKNRTVIVLFAGAVNAVCLKKKPMAALLLYDNIKFYRVNVRTYSKGTPLQKLIRSGSVSRSNNPVLYMSEILRFLTLYKYGGVYLDLDVLVLKSLDMLPDSSNWVGMESEDEIGSALIALTRGGVGKRLAEVAIGILRKNFSPRDWSYRKMRDVLPEALSQVCVHSEACSGFKVYEQPYFYPVSRDHYNDYFSSKTIDFSHSYAAHLWNHHTRDLKITRDSNFAKLSKKYCPFVNKISKKMYQFTDIQRTKVDKLYDSIIINMKNRTNELGTEAKKIGGKKQIKYRKGNGLKYHRVRSRVDSDKETRFRFFNHIRLPKA